MQDWKKGKKDISLIVLGYLLALFAIFVWGEDIQVFLLIILSSILLVALLSSQRDYEGQEKLSERYYNQFIEELNVPVVERDLKGMITYFNDLGLTDHGQIDKYLDDNPEQAERILSLVKVVNVNNTALELYETENKDDLIEYLSDVQHLDKRNLVDQLLLVYFRSGIEIKTTIQTMRGNTRHLISQSYSPPHLKHKFYVLGLDITRLYEQGARFAEVDTKYQQLFMNSPVGITIYEDFPDQDSVLRIVNPAFARIFGYDSPQEMAGIYLDEIQPEEMYEFFVQRYRKRVERKRNYEQYRAYGKKKSGEVFPILLTITFFELGGEKMSLAFVQDMTEEEEYEKERARLLKEVMEARRMEALEVMAGGVVHDFKNLLTPIITGIDLISLDEHVGKIYGDILKSINQTINRARELTEQLLIFTGKAETQLETVDLSGMLESMNGLIKLSIDRSAQITMNLKDNLPKIQVNTSQLQRIVINAVTNSAQAIPKGKKGAIQISTAIRTYHRKNAQQFDLFVPVGLKEEEYVCLIVEDNGHGIDEQSMQKIFTPFYTTKKDGKGLGLAVIQGIMQQYKGGIAIKTQPDVGTTFTFYFPTI